MSEDAMIPCDQVIARLWDHIDGELDVERSREVQAHLDICARCFPEYDFRRAYRTYLRQMAKQSAPPEVRHRIFATILEEEHRTGDGRSGSRLVGLRARLQQWLGRWLRRSG